jgi:bacterioferritin (cytochrome b1)
MEMAKPLERVGKARTSCERPGLDTDATVEVLNRILHFELIGVMQHYHHTWMSRCLETSRPRAIEAGQHIASLIGGPSVSVDNLMNEALATAGEMLDAVRSHEEQRVEEYRKLLELVAGHSEGLEAFARAQIAAEECDTAELSCDTPWPQRARA